MRGFLPVLALLCPLTALAQQPAGGGFGGGLKGPLKGGIDLAPLEDAKKEKVTVDLTPARFEAVAPKWAELFQGPGWAAGPGGPFVAARAEEPMSVATWRAATEAMFEAAGLVIQDGAVAECAWCKGYDAAVDAKATEAAYQELAKRTRGQTWVALWVPRNDLVASPGEKGCLGRSGVEFGVVWYVLGPDCGRPPTP